MTPSTLPTRASIRDTRSPVMYTVANRLASVKCSAADASRSRYRYSARVNTLSSTSNAMAAPVAMMFSHNVQVSVPAPARKAEGVCSGMGSG